MATAPNPADFSVNERANEYEVRFSVRGEIRLTINAESPEDARSKAEAMTEDEEFGLELDDTDEVRVDHVWKTRPMFLVTREGKKMQVSRLDAGDLPREPDDRGF
ncbi:MAG: hypothetical protein JWR51_4664 [Devosia sp.]|uniref:hypothetical protein n=1 Tax=Devosia sp. TaxID=1871048 RepID=UPI002618FA7A|nr:hypothetical protein [Devosia sp.]MDB5531561.1 hypothetical protein [Devosia sp.]